MSKSERKITVIGMLLGKIGFSKIQAILFGISIAILLGSWGVIWWQGSKIDNLQQDLGAAEQREAEIEQRLKEAVDDHNRAVERLRDDIESERRNLDRMQVRFNDMNERLSEIREEAREYQEKYEGDRLARLSATRGAALTRLSKSAALKRNEEWENAIAQFNETVRSNRGGNPADDTGRVPTQ